MSDKYFEVKYCPVCGSENLIIHNLITTGKLIFYGKNFICRACNYEFHLELEKDLSDGSN